MADAYYTPIIGAGLLSLLELDEVSDRKGYSERTVASLPMGLLGS